MKYILGVIFCFLYIVVISQTSFRYKVNQHLAPVGIANCEISKTEVASMVTNASQNRVVFEKFNFETDSLESYNIVFPSNRERKLAPTDIIKLPNGKIVASIEYKAESFLPQRFSDSQIIQITQGGMIGSTALLPFSVGQILQSTDQLFFVERSVLVSTSGANVLRIAKTNLNLNVSWIKSYEIINSFVPDKIIARDGLINSKGNLLVTGETEKYGFLLKIDQNGNVIFFNRFPAQKILSIDSFSAGKYILSGIEEQKNIINIINENGIPLDSRQVEVRGNQIAGKIKKHRNGNFYGIGQMVINRSLKLFVYSFDSDFKLLWAKQYSTGFHFSFRKIEPTEDGGFQFFSKVETIRVALTKLDSLGKLDNCPFTTFCPTILPHDIIAIQPIDWKEDTMTELNPIQITSNKIASLKWKKMCAGNTNPDFGDFEMPDSMCLSSFLKLKNTGGDLIDEWEWFFENGETEFSSKKAPDSIKFKNEGHFKVTRKGWYSGCLDSTSKYVTVLPNDDLFLGNDTLICQNEFFEIVPSLRNDLKIQWQDSSFQNKFFVDSPGIFSATVVDTFCKVIHKDSINIDFFEPYIYGIPSQLLVDTFDCIDSPVVQNLELDSTLKIEWFDGSTTYSKEFNNYGIFDFMVSKDNCSQSFNKTIVPSNCDSGYFVPNSFSPNNDGINDVFSIYSNNNIELQWIKIFDRWGNLSYSGENLALNHEGWNGLFRGEEMGEGVYSWIASILLPNQKIKIDSGDLLLLR